MLCLEGIYEVSYHCSPVGKVQVVQQGLYYHIICRCVVPDGKICRLYVLWGKHRENLGVVVPDEQGFFLDRKIPTKRFGEGMPTFELHGEAQERFEDFVPIIPEEPFAYIDRLKTAFLQSENGKIGIQVDKSPNAV